MRLAEINCRCLTKVAVLKAQNAFLRSHRHRHREGLREKNDEMMREVTFLLPSSLADDRADREDL
jgi:hypothetical protein